jgi:hypothetical protein
MPVFNRVSQQDVVPDLQVELDNIYACLRSLRQPESTPAAPSLPQNQPVSSLVQIEFKDSAGTSIFEDGLEAGAEFSFTESGNLAKITFNVLTTKGDLLGYSTLLARIPVGSNNQVLTADSAQTLGLKWATPATAGVLFSLTKITVDTTLSVDNTLARVIVFPSTTTSKTVTLPNPATQTQPIIFRSRGAGNVVALNGSENIDQLSANVTLNAANELALISDGTDWWSFNRA